LSRIIKSATYQPSEDSVLLSVRPVLLQTETDPERLQKNQQILNQAEEEAKTIIQDAEESAQNILHQAVDEAEMMKQQAMQEIEEWWQQKRAEADALFQEVRTNASREGHEEGRTEGRRQAYEEEIAAVIHAREVLEIAFAEKDRVIAEAEPFLVELSLEVAQKIIGEEVEQNPEHVVEMAKKVLRRSRVHGNVTICVNHHYFELVQDSRAQLLALLDGQAELSIYPDYTVQDGGCVIRTPLGSVDARIDTQLNEIKQVLLEIARGSEHR